MDLLRDRLKQDVIETLERCGSPRGSEAFAVAWGAIDRYAQHCEERARREIVDFTMDRLRQGLTKFIPSMGKEVAP